MDHGQNEFVLTSRFLFGALTLDLPVGLINPRIIKSRGLTILICLIFLPFVSGTFQIILTHGWNCKIFFRDKLVQFWNSSFSSFIIGHLKFWHLFLAFKFWHLSLTSELRHLFFFNFFYMDSEFTWIFFFFLLFFLSFLYFSSLLTLRWLSDGPSNVPVVVPVGDASQLCPGLEIYQNHKYLPSCLVTCQQLAPTEDAAFWTAA